VAALPTGPRMIGTLVHAVVETLVQERGTSLAPPSGDRIEEVFDRLVPQLASELDLPGRSAERAEIRGRTRRSLTELFERTAASGPGGAAARRSLSAASSRISPLSGSSRAAPPGARSSAAAPAAPSPSCSNAPPRPGCGSPAPRPASSCL